MYFILPVMAYLLGSFSSAVWYGRWFKGIDPREHGSKNAGATNALRVLGTKLATAVFITDILKAFLAVVSARFLLKSDASETFYLFSILLGICAVLGHVFPLYTGFKGGKGVASMLGVLLALNAWLALSCVGVFLLVFLLSQIVSLSSITAAVFFPTLYHVAFYDASLSMSIFSVVAAVLVIALHHKNIKRILKGQEKRISFRKQ